MTIENLFLKFLKLDERFGEFLGGTFLKTNTFVEERLVGCTSSVCYRCKVIHPNHVYTLPVGARAKAP